MPLSNCKIINYHQETGLSPGIYPGIGGMRKAVQLRISPKPNVTYQFLGEFSYRIGLKSSNNIEGNLTLGKWRGVMDEASSGTTLDVISAAISQWGNGTGLVNTEFGSGQEDEFLLPSPYFKVWRSSQTNPAYLPNPYFGINSNFIGNPNSEENYMMDPTWENIISLNEDVDIRESWPNYIDRILAFDTLGYDNDGDPLEGNEIIIIVVFSGNALLTLNPGDNIVNLDFDLTAKQKPVTTGMSATGTGGMPAFGGHTQHSDLQIKVKNQTKLTAIDVQLQGEESITITNKNNHNSIKSINNKGILNEEDTTYRIYGKTIKNKSTTVAEIKITTGSGSHFVKAPIFTTDYKDNVFTRIKRKERTGGKITSYTIAIIYNNSQSRIPNIESAIINGTILYKTNVNKRAVTSQFLRKIKFGKNKISDTGETRTISIVGDAGCDFAIAVNECFEDVEQYYEHETSSVTDTGRFIINKHNDVSILGSTANSTTTYKYGKDMEILKGKIPSSGRYSFSQKFPSTKALIAKMNAAANPATRLTLVSTTGIRVGDRLHAYSISSDTIVKVTNIVDSTQIDVDTSVTIANSTNISFSRNRVYSIDIIPDLSSTLKTTRYSYRLKQYQDVSLTVRASTATTDFTISGVGGSAPRNYDLVFAGKRLGGKRREVNVTLTVVKGSGTWSSVNPIYFSKADQLKSRWTNSVPEDNGFTSVSIGKISSSGVGTNTVVIKYKLTIMAIGKKDIIMDLDLDKILT